MHQPGLRLQVVNASTESDFEKVIPSGSRRLGCCLLAPANEVIEYDERGLLVGCGKWTVRRRLLRRRLKSESRAPIGSGIRGMST